MWKCGNIQYQYQWPMGGGESGILQILLAIWVGIWYNIGQWSQKKGVKR